MNYQFFHETLGREMARAKRSRTPLTVIMADIDRFKGVNDTHGRLTGGQALKTVAEHLKTSLRETDCIARYGGEEFAMILFNTQPEDALMVADRARETISHVPIQFGNQTFQITMSLGIATMYPDDALSREELIDLADKALYRAKSAGRNCCRIFHSSATGVAMAS
jgi:diguanylate cyclase (GGDEF)-like protein